ncbi:MAG: tetratricopeptide repeat protein [Deltaproteobacteria bacterium]|nr:tetratricopeptide repeat protein [Deltaproteobacteria bacterium]
MYSRVILFISIVIVVGFFYLHTLNPGTVKFVVTSDQTYVLPVTVLIFGGFIAGVTLMVINLLFADARRALKDMRLRRERKLSEKAEEGFREGVNIFLKGNTKKAIELLEASLDGNPRSRDIRLKLADAYMETGLHSKAAEVLGNHILHNPDDMEVLFDLAICSEKIGDKAGFEKSLREVLRLDKTNPRAIRLLRDMKMREGDWEEAIRCEKTLISSERGENAATREREKKILTGLLYEAALRYIKDDKIDTAEDRAKEALKTGEGNFVPAYILMGELFLKRYNTSGARKLWERAYERTKDVVFLLRLEDIYLGVSNPEGILTLYKDAINRDPGNVNLRLLLSRLYLRLEMVDNAMRELERIEDEASENFFRKLLLAEAYLRRRQSEKAALLFQDAVMPDKDLTPPFRCGVCGYMPGDWHYRCPCCSEWNTFIMSAVTSREIPAYVQSFQKASQ